MYREIAELMNMTEDEVRFSPHLLVNAFDVEHKVLFWNARCEKYFGISEKEAMGKKLEDIVPRVRNNKRMVHLERALSGLPVYLANGKYEKEDGRYDQVLFPIKDAGGKVIAAVNVVIDLDLVKTGYRIPSHESWLN